MIEVFDSGAEAWEASGNIKRNANKKRLKGFLFIMAGLYKYVKTTTFAGDLGS